MTKADTRYLRQQIVGVDSTFKTPFGERLMVYCDYTASGPMPAIRRVLPAEPAARIRQHAYRGRHHGPQHEPAPARGRSKRSRNRSTPGPAVPIVACGTGATGAIDKLQQIIGVRSRRRRARTSRRCSADPDRRQRRFRTRSNAARRVHRAVRASLQRDILAPVAGDDDRGSAGCRRQYRPRASRDRDCSRTRATRAASASVRSRRHRT